MESIKNFFGKISSKISEVREKAVALFKEKTKNIKWKEVWDKCTTGLLILLMCSPVLILAYIFLWFIFR